MILKRVKKLENLVGNCEITCDIENKSILFRYRDDNDNLIHRKESDGTEYWYEYDEEGYMTHYEISRS